MTTRLRGKAREEVISKFLQNIDDPDWEVTPLSTEGKYKITPRKKTEEIVLNEQSEDNNEDNNEYDEDSENDESTDSESEHKEIKESIKEKQTKPKPKKQNTRIQYNPEILATLQSLKDEITYMKNMRMEKEEKKERKREVKRLIRKEKDFENLSNAFTSQKQEPIVQQATQWRRRVNLLRK